MIDADLLCLADEIRATVEAEVRTLMGPAYARIAELDTTVAALLAEVRALIGPAQSRIVEMGATIATLSAEVETLKARIERVAVEPRIVLNPQFIVPQVAPPAVHVAPVFQLPARKPIKRSMSKDADGKYVIEERE